MVKKSNIIKIKDKELKLLLLGRFFEQRFHDLEIQKTIELSTTNLKFLMLTFLPVFVIYLIQLLIDFYKLKIKVYFIIILPLFLIIYVIYVFKKYIRGIGKIKDHYTVGHNYEYYANLLKNIEEDWFLVLEHKNPDYYEMKLKRPPFILELYPKNQKLSGLERE